MKHKSRSLLLLGVMTILCFPSWQFADAGEPTVAEIREDGGISVIRVTAADGRELAAYRIDMGKHHHPAAGPDDPLVKKFQAWRFGAFLCFNSNQYSGTEFCGSKDPVRDFQPTALDVRQWIKTIKDAGMTYAVLTVRHTSEFLLWDSATSHITVMHSAIKKDLVQEYVRECRRQGIEPGIYYCLWGNRWRPNPHARAIILCPIARTGNQVWQDTLFLARYAALYRLVGQGSQPTGNLRLPEER